MPPITDRNSSVFPKNVEKFKKFWKMVKNSSIESIKRYWNVVYRKMAKYDESVKKKQNMMKNIKKLYKEWYIVKVMKNVGKWWESRKMGDKCWKTDVIFFFLLTIATFISNFTLFFGSENDICVWQISFHCLLRFIRYIP